MKLFDWKAFKSWLSKPKASPKLPSGWALRLGYWDVYDEDGYLARVQYGYVILFDGKVKYLISVNRRRSGVPGVSPN